MYVGVIVLFNFTFCKKTLNDLGKVLKFNFVVFVATLETFR